MASGLNSGVSINCRKRFAKRFRKPPNKKEEARRHVFIGEDFFDTTFFWG